MRNIPVTWLRAVATTSFSEAHRPIVLVVIVGAAFAMRLTMGIIAGWDAPAATSRLDLGDGSRYERAAHDIVAGRGLVESTRGIPAGYPFFLASVFSAAGDHPAAARMLQALLGALTVLFVYMIGRLVWSPTIGIAASVRRQVDVDQMMV